MTFWKLTQYPKHHSAEITENRWKNEINYFHTFLAIGTIEDIAMFLRIFLKWFFYFFSKTKQTVWEVSCVCSSSRTCYYNRIGWFRKYFAGKQSISKFDIFLKRETTSDNQGYFLNRVGLGSWPAGCLEGTVCFLCIYFDIFFLFHRIFLKKTKI